MNSKQTRRANAVLAPWHATALSAVRAAWSANRLPHALLLHGTAGLGKSQFADWLARAALCDVPQEPLAPCGTCASCLLLEAESHPDLIRVSPPEDKQSILIEQIREACGKLALTSYRRGRKVAILTPADRMTIAAANSLLKTLEEPTPNSLLMLVTSRPANLPATIRSRCMKIGFPVPQRSQALEWLRDTAGAEVDPAVLEFAAGAPFAALALADGAYAELDQRMRAGLNALLAGQTDLSALASDWAARDLDARLQWLESWCAREIRQRFCGIADQVTLAGGAAPLPTPAPALNISGLYGLLDAIRELRMVLTRTALQKELAVESLLIRLMRCIGPAERRGTSHQ